MKTINTFLSSSLLCAALLYSNGAIAAKGGNKPPAAPSIAINSVIVDRLNTVILVEGIGLSGATFELGGLAVPANTLDNSAAISFGSEIDNVVNNAGNYNLVVNGETSFSIYIDGDIIDSGLSGCPCSSGWSHELNTLRPNWQDGGSCIEMGTDIAGSIFDPDSVSGNQIFIGAAYTANPTDSVCRLVEVDSSTAEETDLVIFPVNSTQQSECATYIKNDLGLNCITFP